MLSVQKSHFWMWHQTQWDRQPFSCCSAHSSSVKWREQKFLMVLSPVIFVGSSVRIIEMMCSVQHFRLSQRKDKWAVLVFFSVSVGWFFLLFSFFFFFQWKLHAAMCCKNTQFESTGGWQSSARKEYLALGLRAQICCVALCKTPALKIADVQF